MATTLLIGSVDCNDRVSTRLMAMSLGKPGRFAEEYGGPAVDIAAVGSVDTSQLVESRFTVEVSGASVDAVTAIVASIAAEVRDLADITVGLDGSSYTGTLKVRIGECVEIPLDEPWNVALMVRHMTRVEIIVRREPWVYGAARTLYDAATFGVPAIVRLGWPSGRNLLTNPSCEKFTAGLADGWAVSSGVAGTVTKAGAAGGNSPSSQEIYYHGLAGDTNAYIVVNDGAVIDGSLIAGTPATFQVMLRCGTTHTGVNVRLQLQPYNAAWGALTAVNGLTLPITTAWETFAVTYPELPYLTAYVVANVVIDSIDNGNIVDLFIDNAMLSPDSVILPYFDGSLGGDLGAWTGAANASTSTRTECAALGEAPCPLDLSVAAVATNADIRGFWAGVYPDPEAIITDFVKEMHTPHQTWQASSVGADAGGWPDGVSWTVQQFAGVTMDHTAIDTSHLLPGEYLVLVRAKTDDDPRNVYVGTSLVEAEMTAVSVANTMLDWYPVGVFSLPANKGPAGSSAPLYVGMKTDGVDILSINVVVFIPTSWGMVGWHDPASHCHALEWKDGTVYADGTSGLAHAYGSRPLCANEGVIVTAGGAQQWNMPTLETSITIGYTPRWEQLPSADYVGAADRRALYGFHSSLLLVTDDAQRARSIAADRWLGAEVNRISYDWYYLEPTTQGVYDWNALAYEDSTNEIVAAGMTVIGAILSSPQWANGSPDSFLVPGTGVDATYLAWEAKFLSFLTALVNHYKDRVKHWEIGNESNNNHFWTPDYDIAQYAHLYTAARTTILAADSTAKVCVGGLGPPGYTGGTDAVTFMQGLWTAGCYPDYVAIHPYNNLWLPPSNHTGDAYGDFDDIDRLHNAMLTHGGSAIAPIWVSEWGWTSSLILETLQAQYIADSLAMIRDLYPFVEIACLFRDVDGGDGFGLYRPGAIGRKPSALAFRKFMDSL